jgi:hypothetical protein
MKLYSYRGINSTINGRVGTIEVIEGEVEFVLFTPSHASDDTVSDESLVFRVKLSSLTLVSE